MVLGFGLFIFLLISPTLHCFQNLINALRTLSRIVIQTALDQLYDHWRKTGSLNTREFLLPASLIRLAGCQVMKDGCPTVEVGRNLRRAGISKDFGRNVVLLPAVLSGRDGGTAVQVSGRFKISQ